MATRKIKKKLRKSGSKSKNSAVKKIQSAYRNKQTRKKSKAATKLQKTFRESISRKECAICLERGADFKTKCKHYFHKECLKKWCKNKGVNCLCPLCRKKIEDEEVIGKVRTLKEIQQEEGEEARFEDATAEFNEFLRRQENPQEVEEAQEALARMIRPQRNIGGKLSLNPFYNYRNRKINTDVDKFYYYNNNLFNFISSGTLKDIKNAINYGVNIKQIDYEGWTVLMEASKRGDIKILNLLLDSGAQDIIDEKFNNEKEEIDGWTALMIASYFGHRELVDELIQRGANVNIKSNEGESAKDLACKLINLEKKENCKDDLKEIFNKNNYKGGKKERKGPSDSATKFSVGTKKRGNDGNMWIIIKVANGSKRWKKVDKTKKLVDEDTVWGKNKKLENFWRKLALGEQVVVVYGDDKKRLNMPKTRDARKNKYKELEDDKNVKAIITSAMSSDTYESLYKKVKNKTPEEIIKNYKKYLTNFGKGDKTWYL